MKEPTEQIRWVVAILLVIAAIIAILLNHAFNAFGAVVLTILLAICGGLAVRYREEG